MILFYITKKNRLSLATVRSNLNCQNKVPLYFTPLLTNHATLDQLCHLAVSKDHLNFCYVPGILPGAGGTTERWIDMASSLRVQSGPPHLIAPYW